jgi:hypothetical protein
MVMVLPSFETLTPRYFVLHYSFVTMQVHRIGVLRCCSAGLKAGLKHRRKTWCRQRLVGWTQAGILLAPGGAFVGLRCGVVASSLQGGVHVGWSRGKLLYWGVVETGACSVD